MSRRGDWIIKVVDARGGRWSATHRLARVVGTETAARWAKEARALRPGVLGARVRREQQN